MGPIEEGKIDSIYQIFHKPTLAPELAYLVHKNLKKYNYTEEF